MDFNLHLQTNPTLLPPEVRLWRDPVQGPLQNNEGSPDWDWTSCPTQAVAAGRAVLGVWEELWRGPRRRTFCRDAQISSRMTYRMSPCFPSCPCNPHVTESEEKVNCQVHRMNMSSGRVSDTCIHPRQTLTCRVKDRKLLSVLKRHMPTSARDKKKMHDGMPKKRGPWRQRRSLRSAEQPCKPCFTGERCYAEREGVSQDSTQIKINLCCACIYIITYNILSGPTPNILNLFQTDHWTERKIAWLFLLFRSYNGTAAQDIEWPSGKFELNLFVCDYKNFQK